MLSLERHVILRERSLSTDFCYLAATLFSSRWWAFQEHRVLFKHGECRGAIYCLIHSKIRDLSAFFYMYITKRPYIYILCINWWTRKNIFQTIRYFIIYFLLYCFKTMFCLGPVLHCTFFKDLIHLLKLNVKWWKSECLQRAEGYRSFLQGKVKHSTVRIFYHIRTASPKSLFVFWYHMLNSFASTDCSQLHVFSVLPFENHKKRVSCSGGNVCVFEYWVWVSKVISLKLEARRSTSVQQHQNKLWT